MMRDVRPQARAYENAVLEPGRGGDAEVAGPVRSSRGVVTEAEHDDERKGTVMVREPAVEAPPLVSQLLLPVGEDVTVTLTEADPVTRKVRFSL